ncbi:MAG: T9SS type A sorting domain-containing protein [Candidatus Krumholzibacteria bacterium]|nr:T9SS type A sorting domain-containing protein [Candidatus Krumholzibacteria bacterium]
MRRSIPVIFTRIVISALIVISLLVISFPVSNSRAREPEKKPVFLQKEWSKDDYAGALYELTGNVMAPAAVDTFHIVRYDFEVRDWQGWTSIDQTAQHDTFWHVDDFAGLGGGDYGRLTPLEGSKSMWCGARPGVGPYMCGWNSAPGYGNRWYQSLVTEPFSFLGGVTLSFRVRVDSEEEYDFLRIEYNKYFIMPWEELIALDGVVDTVISCFFAPPSAMTKLRFHFSSDGAWSDEDGLWDSDGACIIDSITISDNRGLIDFEDFESAEVGDRSVGIWYADTGEFFGTYANLRGGIQDSDPCNQNSTTMIAFWDNTCFPSLEYPGMYVTPWCEPAFYEEGDICQREGVMSPVIDMTKYSSGRDEFQDLAISPADQADLGGAILTFTVYGDLPYGNLVYYNWSVRSIVDGCPDQWRDRGFGYGGGHRDYYFSRYGIADLLKSDSIQVLLQIMDMCDVWFDSYGDCAEHTPSPLFDNVEILRYKTNGPQWQYRALNLFQDNFPSGTDIESWIRADMANDIRPPDNPVIDPGDSIVLTCTSPLGGGIEEDAGGARVYMHVKCEYVGHDDLKADISGPSLEGTYGSYHSDDGTWTIIQADSARHGSGYPSTDRHMFDLNDSLLTRGYVVEYYFKAYDLASESTTLPEDAASGDYFEFTCLPTFNNQNLYVDDFDGRGSAKGIVQDYLDATFAAIWPWEMGPPDRYDVNFPAYPVSNGPGSRAKVEHLLAAYQGIIWDSGNLNSGTITGENHEADKSNDCRLLIDWLDLLPDISDPGLLVMGDGVAVDLHLSGSADAMELLTDYCGVNFVHDSYFDMTGGADGGGMVIPLITGLDVLSGIDFYIDGSCPLLEDFDVLEKTESGTYLLQYPDFSGMPYYAGIGNTFVNSEGTLTHTAWFGFSFMHIRNGNGGTLTRNKLMEKILRSWLQTKGAVSDPTGGDIPAVTSLARNYPNPFNPSTTLKFNLALKGHVSLKIYNVAGQLVRTLVSEDRDPGSYNEAWDGTSDSGSKVASGVYFYRMKTGNFEQTRKMVLLR